MNKPLKLSLLYVVTLASATGKYGGPFDTHTHQARIAHDMGFDATLLAGFLPGDAPAGESLRGVKTNFTQVRIPIPRLGFTNAFSGKMGASLFKAIRASDIVHVSSAREMIPVTAMFLCLVLRVPYVAQGHGMLTSRSSLMHRVVDMVVRPLMRSASSVIALTEVEASEIIGWMGRNHPPVHILGNPVPPGLSPRLRTEADRDEALFVARLHKRKRVGHFLGAAAAASLHGQSHKFVVIGPDEGEMELVNKTTSVLTNTVYEGAVSAAEVSRRVERTGVFVLTSDREPWGNVVAVALASGVPVVVPRSAALAGRIEGHHAGAVYPDGDISALNREVHALLSDKGLYQSCSAGALALAAAALSDRHQEVTLGHIYSSATGSLPAS